MLACPIDDHIDGIACVMGIQHRIQRIHIGDPLVIDADKNYIGGMILPGVGVSLDALTHRASQLSGISIEAPKKVIGKNTIDCMKSGVLYSNAGAIDGIIERIEEELGEKSVYGL